MEQRREDLVVKFLRTYTHPFSLSEMKKVFEACGIDAEAEDIQIYLASSPNVLQLSNNKFLTHAGAFTSEIFSIMPIFIYYLIKNQILMHIFIYCTIILCIPINVSTVSNTFH